MLLSCHLTYFERWVLQNSIHGFFNYARCYNKKNADA